MERSRIPQFYKMSVPERVRTVHDRGLLGPEDYQVLKSGRHTLSVQLADKMIENVIGVMGLPVGLGLNFLINDKEYVVPLVVEEPSIVAALGSAAKLARSAGGFTVESTEPRLIGQIQIVDVADPARAKATLLQRKDEILNLANSLHPKMIARGGGAKDLEVYIHPSQGIGGDMVVAHLLVDTCDAMGANLVNTMCEGVASLVENMADGRVFLRILSNLTDRALVRAKVRIPVSLLTGKGFDGEQVRDGIIVANDFARVDPYRAATHNKGIMNGVDAVALATGNDWRAIEAGAHAYAARGGRYTSLTSWTCADNGDLLGELEIPLKVGTVGGPLQTNPTVALNLRMLGVESARELAEVMGAVGLAQNFSAIRALVTEGIQQGHMTLHARSVATAAGVPPELFDTVVERLIASGEIKVWKAADIMREVAEQSASSIRAVSRTEEQETLEGERLGAGHGKIILLGEHAVVYGRRAIAAPIPLAIQARVEDAPEGVELIIPRWGIEQRLDFKAKRPPSFAKSMARVLSALDLENRGMRIEVFPNVPRAMGLGGSAALAVAVIRAIDLHFRLGLDDERINELAFECEKVAHGTPSGLDNTLATYGEFTLFRRGEDACREIIEVSQPLPIVIGMSRTESLTARTVARVREAWQRNPDLYDRIFDEIDTLAGQGLEALKSGDYETLGELMNVCQGLLNAMQVSSWELEELIQVARNHGAVGAKLTGGGGGGSIIALCPDDSARVARAIREAGYHALEVSIGQT
ncbi:hydroxymethylglutaryl-CoA reductase, degradative [Wenzhouxiangella sp. AB-CW3]|uniref:hydroxymethylglutaryl-CoA reductase, degradative n=1 Tax=Wenzhouxiangella sp. AB-CW3 TaxID=2771012 RepID=UPI00168B2098|nr:hydroxymethylglutaryl-CoA reductase, degradative [Wenzhouxiangella sp. AB-CW3]QOC23349.1 hydroxymethylglutaryl-CoA reductase, degradative [Wenzhouxiangella sp. AB-CW3]